MKSFLALPKSFNRLRIRNGDRGLLDRNSARASMFRERLPRTTNNKTTIVLSKPGLIFELKDRFGVFAPPARDHAHLERRQAVGAVGRAELALCGERIEPTLVISPRAEARRIRFVVHGAINQNSRATAIRQQARVSREGRKSRRGFMHALGVVSCRSTPRRCNSDADVRS